MQRRLPGNLLELKHRGTAEDGVEHIEIGILRGGGDKGDFSVFDVFQQGLLLLFVEGLNLVQIQQHPIGGHKGIQLGHNVFNVSGGGGGGIELVQGAVGLLCDNIGNGGLSRAAGAIENHIGDISGVNKPAQDALFPQNMLLPIHLVQGSRTKQVCKGLIHSFHLPF